MYSSSYILKNTRLDVSLKLLIAITDKKLRDFIVINDKTFKLLKKKNRLQFRLLFFAPSNLNMRSCLDPTVPLLGVGKGEVIKEPKKAAPVLPLRR